MSSVFSKQTPPSSETTFGSPAVYVSRKMGQKRVRNFSKISKRTSLVHANSQAHRTRQEKALQTVLLALNSDKQSDHKEGNPPPSAPEEQQQLCPSKSPPNDFLKYKSSDRPNPVFGPRGKLRLDSFQVSMLNFKSQLKPLEPLYRPQGAHPITGQALPPLFNNDARLATGKDTAALTEQGYRFAFQVVNNNYHIQNPVPGSLNIRHEESRNESPRFTTKALSRTESGKSVEEGRNKIRRKQVQSTFVGHTAPSSTPTSTRMPEIPRSCTCVKDILRMWAFSDFSKGLKKPLKDWSADERNGKIPRAHGKEISNRKLYSRRKVQAMCFFHYCETHSVEQYIGQFTELNERKVIGKNYKMALEYAKKHGFKEIFKEEQLWKLCTERALHHSDVKKALSCNGWM